MTKPVPDRLDGSTRQLLRFWSDVAKAIAVEQAYQPGVAMSAVARQIEILPSKLYRWRKELLDAVRQDEVSIMLQPGEGAEAKLVMLKGAKTNYPWTAKAQ